MSNRVKIYGSNGDPRHQAERDPFLPDERPHGLSPAEMQRMERLASLEPSIVKLGAPSRSLFDDILPEGASLDPRQRRTAQSSSFSGPGQSTLISPQRPYQPEFASADRISYPIHRLLANRYWRLFAKVDAFTRTFINMLSDLVWSDFQLTGEGVDGEIKALFEGMVEETQFRSNLPWLLKEYLILGEVCPHLFFDESKGMWTHITFLNPDQLEVVYTPFVKMDPLVEFVPDDRLRAVVTSSHPHMRRIREMMPPELISRLSARSNLPLSPVNFTFIPNKAHPYDVRGTSMLSPLWRVYMIEDALAESLIATARRASRPIKAIKLGTPDGSWIPNEAYEKKILGLLAQAELDSEAFIAVHAGVNFELWGDPQRALNLSNQFDMIERWKLIAFGVNKAFVLGESSYSAAAAGLTTFLQRLKAYRELFESSWIIPKYFRGISKINQFYKPKPSEVSGPGPWVRTKRSAYERDDGDLIVPTIEWAKPLDQTDDATRLSAIGTLEQLGVPISKKTKMATVNLDYETELKQIKKELEIAHKIVGKDLELAAATKTQVPGMAPPQVPEGGSPTLSPGLPPGSLTGPGPGGPEMGGAPPPDLGPAPPTDTIPIETGASKGAEEGHVDEPRLEGWDQDALRGVVSLFKDMDGTDDSIGEPWTDMVASSTEVQNALQSNDASQLWMAVEDWLINEGFPTRQITNLQDVLTKKNLIRRADLVDASSLARIEAHISKIIGESANGVSSHTGVGSRTK